MDMYTQYSCICPVCGNDQILDVNDNIMNNDSVSKDVIVVLGKNTNGTFNCEVNVKCIKCRHFFREIKEIAYV